MLCPSVISRFGTLADKPRFDAASARVISAQSTHYRRSRRVRFAPKANNGQDKGRLAAQ